MKFVLMAVFFVLLLEEIQFLSLKVSFLCPCPCVLMCNLVNLLLEISIHLFYLPFLFSSFCCFSVFFNVILKSFYWCVYTVLNTDEFFFSFSWYIQSTSSLKCKDLSIVINFLVLWSIYLSSSLVYFKNGPKYLTKSTTLVFTPLMRFLPQNLVSRRFLVLLRYSFLIYSFISTCLWLSGSNILTYL